MLRRFWYSDTLGFFGRLLILSVAVAITFYLAAVVAVHLWEVYCDICG